MFVLIGNASQLTRFVHQYMRAVSPMGGRDTNGAKTNAAHTSKEHISEILQFQYESTLEVLIYYF